MDLQNFLEGSGLKVLSLSKLTSEESSIVFYFLNCAFSGLSEIIISDDKLASLIGMDPKKTSLALNSLIDKNIIKSRTHKDSSIFTIEFDISKWKVQGQPPVKEALVYPFHTNQKPSFTLINTSVTQVPMSESSYNRRVQTIEDQILTEYCASKNIPEQSLSLIKQDLSLLLSTYPADKVLALVKHFKHKLPSLSLLASAWSHFIEIYEIETQIVDMNLAKKKQEKMDQELRDNVNQLLTNSSRYHLSSDEISVLNMILSHKFPRRQLYWAYEARTNYPNLKDFFEQNKKYMLAVTNSGKTLKEF